MFDHRPSFCPFPPVSASRVPPPLKQLSASSSEATRLGAAAINSEEKPADPCSDCPSVTTPVPVW